MVDSELLEVLTNFTDEIKDKMNSFKDEIKGEIDSFKSEIKGEMNSFKREIKGEMNSFKGEMNSFRDELADIKERLTSIENKCTVIEEEHGRKLDLLLDYASSNIEKHEEYDKRFDRIDNKLFIHDAKLAIIEGSDIYQKMIKGKGKSNLRNAIL